MYLQGEVAIGANSLIFGIGGLVFQPEKTTSTHLTTLLGAILKA